MKKLSTHISFVIITTLSIAMNSFGQVYINGKIKDRQKNLPSVTVTLLDTDSVPVKRILTGPAGEFVFENVKPGHYFISLSAVGYINFISKPLEVGKKDIVFPDIVLEEKANEMKEVVVKAKKPLYDQQIDKLVVNVQSNITSSGNSILDVLQKSPGIVVNKQDNSITMNGKSGVRVMINGKMMQLPLDAVVQMLEGMSSSNVEKIELIATPPAKYDADGSAGIIHIIMKGAADFGTNGSFGLTLGKKWAETFGGNFNINHRTKNLAFFIDYSILRDHNLHLSTMNRQLPVDGFVQVVDDYSHRENITTQQNFDAGIEWKLTGNTSLSFSFTAYRRNWDMNATTKDNNYVTHDSTVITDMKIHESNIWQSATAGIGLQTKINSKTEASISLDYLYYHNDNPSEYDNLVHYYPANITVPEKIGLQKGTPIQFLIARADFQYNMSSSLTWEGGIKGVTSNLDNNVLVQRFADSAWKADPLFTSYSTLAEQSGAVYLSGKWQPGNKWQINGGLRYEYTHTSISAPMQKNVVNRKYGYPFPSIFFKKDLGNKKDFQFSYSRRITRPTYNDIAPFVFFWGPGTFSAGNTALFPAISDAVKTGYRSGKWIVSLQASHSKNEIAFLQPEIDSATGNLIYRSQNMKYLDALGITNTVSFKVASWWEVQANVTAQYQTAKTSNLEKNTVLNIYGLNANVSNTIRLPRDFVIEFSGTYQSKLLSGISTFLPVGSFNAGIQKRFGEKGTLRLAMDDIFNTNYWKIRTYLPENKLDSYFKYQFHNQFIRLTYSRNFGNKKINSVKLKSGAEEEKGRVVN